MIVATTNALNELHNHPKRRPSNIAHLKFARFSLWRALMLRTPSVKDRRLGIRPAALKRQRPTRL